MVQAGLIARNLKDCRTVIYNCAHHGPVKTVSSSISENLGFQPVRDSDRLSQNDHIDILKKTIIKKTKLNYRTSCKSICIK